MVFSCLDDYSASAGQMQTTVDPYPASVVSLPTTGQGELERLRFMWAHVMGTTYWYTHPENINFRHRRVEMHMAAITGLQEMFVGQQTWSNASVRFHGVAFGVADQASHPESVLARFHVGGNTKFMVSKLGDLHAATLGLHQGGSIANPAIFHLSSATTGLWFHTTNQGAALNHLGVSISGTQVARFHANGLVVSQLLFQHAASGRWVGFKAHATSSSTALWTLPNADGAQGTVLQTDGVGTLGWVTSTTLLGLPANVNVLGSRTASGEFIQHATLDPPTAGTTGQTLYASSGSAVSYAVAFSSTPKVAWAGTTENVDSFGFATQITTTGFTLKIWSRTSGEDLTNGAWIAHGT